jgi:hypothetical protein
LAKVANRRAKLRYAFKFLFGTANRKPSTYIAHSSIPPVSRNISERPAKEVLHYPRRPRAQKLPFNFKRKIGCTLKSRDSLGRAVERRLLIA